MLHAVWFSEVPLGRPLHHFPVADISEEPMWCFCKLWTQLTTTDLSSCIKAGKPSSNPVWLVFSVKHPDEQVNISNYTVTACLFKKKCSFCKILFQYRPLRRVNKFYKYLEGNLRETQVGAFFILTGWNETWLIFSCPETRVALLALLHWEQVSWQEPGVHERQEPGAHQRKTQGTCIKNLANTLRKRVNK